MVAAKENNASGSSKPKAKKDDEAAKHVHFDETFSLAASNKPKKTTRKPYRGEDTKVHMGKFNPFRDGMIVILAIGFMILVGRDFDPKKTNKEDPKPRSAALVALDLMKAKFSESFAEKRRTEPCDLFLDASAVPGAGLSYFAGRNYTEGELVLDTTTLFPLTMTSETDNPLFLYLPAHAFLLKHRPNMTNVEGELVVESDSSESSAGTKRFELRATTAIHEGDELFVPFDAHPHSRLPAHSSTAFAHIPTAASYSTVRVILDDIHWAFRRVAAGKKVKRESTNSGLGVSLVKRAVMHVDPTVGNLLPEGKGKFEVMRKLFPLWSSWNGKAMIALQATGKCLSDAAVVQGDASTIVATKSFKKGDVIMSAPLHVMQNDRTCIASGDGECRPPSGSTSLCFGHESSSLVFCPLALSALLDPVSDNANVEYRWTSKSMRKLSIEDALASKPGDLSWDVVATEDIEKGDTVRMVLTTSKSLPNMRTIRDALLSAQWKL